MLKLSENDRRDASVLIALLAVLLFLSPLALWWTGPDSPWYFPYLVWGGIIGLAALIQMRSGRGEP